MLKIFRFVAAAAFAIAALAPQVPAKADTITIFLTERNAGIRFPFGPPNRATGGPGVIDNMDIGNTTPKAGTFTTLKSASQTCTTDPCTETGVAGAQGGAINSIGGTSSTSANPGGAAGLTGGVPGATGAGGAAAVVGGAGGSTSGTGGAASVTGGAGTAGNANGGDVTIAGGAANGSGVNGVVRENGVVFRQQAAQATQDTAATLTTVQLSNGIITSAPAGAIALTLPLATGLDTAFPTSVANDSFDFSVINTSSTGANTNTMTTNTGWTLVGNMVITPLTTGGTAARFRARKTGTGAWTLYRLA